MEIKESLIELVDQLNLNTLPVDNSEIDFSFCLPLILNQFPEHCKPPSTDLEEEFNLANSNIELIGWKLESSLYTLLYNLNSIDYYDYLEKSESKLKNEDLISYWENLADIETFLNNSKYEEVIKLLIDTLYLIPTGSPSSIIDDNASIGQNIDRLKNILNVTETTKIVGLLLSLIYLQLGFSSDKFSLESFISFFNLIQLNQTSTSIFLCNTISEWSEFISITVKYGIDSCFNPQLTQYAVKLLSQSLKLQPQRKIEFLRLVKSTPFMSDEVLRLPNDNPSQIADYWNALLLDPQSLISSISPSNNIPSNSAGWNLLFWENFAPTASSNSSINLMKIDSLLRCTLAYQKHVGGLITEPFNAHTKVMANIYKALAPSPFPERVYCSTLAFLLVNLTFRFPNHNQYVRHLLEKFMQIFPYGVSYLLGMIFRLPDSWEQLKKDLNGWMGVEYPLNAMDPHQINAVKEHFLTEGIYPKRAKEILLSLPYTYYQPKEDHILVFGQPTNYCLESMILLHVNCKEYLNCDKWILNMITQIPKFPIPPHAFRLIDVFIQRVVNKLSPKIPESSIKLHLSDCYPHKPILPKHILLSYYYIKFYNCLVPEISCINPDITDLSYSHQILDNIPITEISKIFQHQSKFGLESYYYNYKGLLAQFFKYTINSQNSFNRNFELNSHRKPIGIYPIENEVIPNTKSLYPSLIVQDLLKNSSSALLLYEFLLKTPHKAKLFKYCKSVIEFGIKDCLTQKNDKSTELEFKFVKIWKKLHLKLPNLVWNYTLQGCSLVQLDSNHQLNNLVKLESLMTDVMMSFRLPQKIYRSKYLIQIPLTMALCSLLGWKEKLLYGYLIKPAEFRNGMGFDGFNAAIVSEYTWLLQTLIELMNPKKLTNLPSEFNSINSEITKACDTLLLESGNLVKSLLRQGFDVDMIPQVLNNLPAARAAINEREFSKATIDALLKGSDCQKWFGICLSGHVAKFVEYEAWGVDFKKEFLEPIMKIANQYFDKLPFHNFTLRQYISPSQVKDALVLIMKNYPNCKSDMNNLINSLPFDSAIAESNRLSPPAQSPRFNSKFQYAYLSWKVTQISSPQTTSPSNKAARPTTPTNAPHQPPSRGGNEFANDDYHSGKRGSTNMDYDDPPPSKLSNMGGYGKKYKSHNVDNNNYRPPQSQNYTKPPRANSSNIQNPRGNKSPNNLQQNNVRPNVPQYHSQHSQSQPFREGRGGRMQDGGSRPQPGRNPGGYASNNRDPDDRFTHSNNRPRGKSFPRGGGGGSTRGGRSSGGGSSRRGSNVE